MRARLAALVDGREAFDTVEAALLIAAEEYPELDLARDLARVRALARAAGLRARGRQNPFARLDAVRTYLFEELGFRGNVENYDDPRNSYLNEVLDRRTGIPLTLSLILMQAGLAAGFEVRGIGLPGHFVVGLRWDGRDILADPFHGGQVIVEDDCRQLVARATGRPSLFRRELLLGVNDRAIIKRLLGNLKRVHLGRDDHRRALTVVERLLLLTPGDPHEIRDRGFLLAHLGRPGAAVVDLETYLELDPAAPDAASVRGRLAWLRRRLTEIN